MLEEYNIRVLKEPVLMNPGTVYEIKVVYEGDSTYTYTDTLEEVKDEDDDDFTLLVKKNFGDLLFHGEQRVYFCNLITGVGIDVLEK
eukprot:CAMPEP_0114594824 /NCGR_PEP_ID=MMETSP0125-20121206/16542_1 /TAXON_ID=485358 ORGANISM="Aristerostoma sp., Strain ATCC 50986" /NCGR_SAMPLE_ID=MMETSP0125 /ASSEMBLY_ACC=CAM_ASM_000245 /LENGTH=86 /DNA_ID=CAMNT_0001795637 /DNA_START=162 /DNA_END=419 /DNA_ORIENTATION=-